MDKAWDAVYNLQENWGTGTEPSDFHLESITKLSLERPDVLDIGCGNGRNVKNLVGRAGRVDLLDASAVALQMASRNLPQHPSLNFQVGRVEDVVLAREQYDIVFFCGVLNCVPITSWAFLCDKVSDSIKQDAILIFTVFNEMSDPASVDGVTIVDLSPLGCVSKMFPAFSIAKMDVRTFRHSHPSKGPHTHVLERYVMRKKTPWIKKSKGDFRVSVLGANDVSFAEAALNVPRSAYYAAAKRLGHAMRIEGAGFVGVPDGKDGVVRATLDAYLDGKNAKRPTILYPNLDLKNSSARSNWMDELIETHGAERFEIVTGITWQEQVSLVTELSDVAVCVCLGAGTLTEIGWTKWSRRPVAISNDLCSVIPREVSSRLQVLNVPTFENAVKVALRRELHRRS